MARKKDSIDILKESLAPGIDKLSSIFKKGADKTRETFLLLRPLSKNEQWGVDSMREYISEDSANQITAAIKQDKAKLKFIKKGFSFLVANKDLVPQLTSRKFRELNEQVEREFYSASFKNFTERSWQALPQYIGPNTLGQLDIKKAICLQLFSPEPIKILIVGEIDPEVLTSARKLAPSTFQIINDFTKADFDKFILAVAKSENDKFDLLFHTKIAKLEEFEDIAESIILGSKAKVKEADIDFLREYIREGRKIKVEIPAHLSDKLKEFVVGLKKKEKKLKYNITPALVSCIVNLCKASARTELRTEVESKDLVRVFEIVEKSLKA